MTIPAVDAISGLMMCVAAVVGCVGGRAAWQRAHQILVRRHLPSELDRLPKPIVTSCAFAAVSLSITSRYGATPELVEMLVFLWLLLVCSLTDIAAWLIPNGCVLAALAARALYLGFVALTQGTVAALSLATQSLSGALGVLLPLVAITLVMDRILQTESMGGGDLKLFAASGAFFGWRACLFIVPLSCILGISFALLRKGWSHTFPFGPAIAAACWLTSLFGADVIAWWGSLPL